MPEKAYLRRAIEPQGTVHAARYAGDRDHFTTACAVYPAPEVDQLDASPERAVTCPGCRAATGEFARQSYTGNCDTCRAYWGTLQDLGEEWAAAPRADRPPLSDQIARALAMYGEHAIGHLTGGGTR